MKRFSEPGVLKALREAHALRADRVFREMGTPPVFGKENRADSKRGSAFLFLQNLQARRGFRSGGRNLFRLGRQPAPQPRVVI